MMLAPIVEELARESDGSYRIGKVDIDEQLELMDRFEISAIPLLIVFKNGEEVARHVGYMEKEELIALIESAKAN
jgi:thioredoxin 1